MPFNAGPSLRFLDICSYLQFLWTLEFPHFSLRFHANAILPSICSSAYVYI